MNTNDLLSEPPNHSLQDNDVIKQHDVIERDIDDKKEREKETCQNCGTCFSSNDDYVTLCNKCRYELLGI